MGRVTAFIICFPLLLTTASALAAAETEQESPLRATANFLPPEVEQILAQGDLELLSLSPTLLTDKQRQRLRKKLFRGYKVLGRVKIQKGPQRDQLLQALQKAIADSPPYYVYCFEPRHAIQASVGAQTVDLVICFACERIELYSPERSLVGTNEAAQPVLDAVLKRAGVSLGPRP